MFYGQDKKKEQENAYPDLDERQPPPKPQQSQQSKNRGGQSSDMRTSVFLKGDKKEEEKEEGCCARCCKCCSLEYYRDYFKVTNADVWKRIKCNLKFWSGDFFKPLEQDYDLYGPFWLYTTMIFVIGAVHNMIVYQNTPESHFEYNFKIIGVGFTVFYLLGLGLSALIGLLFGCLGLKSTVMMVVCLYGYSMATYIVCVVLCMIDIPMLHWLFLLYAGGSKVVYILRNVFESLDVPISKKIPIIVVVAVEAGIQFLIIKFAFMNMETYSEIMKSLNLHEMATPYLHARTFNH